MSYEWWVASRYIWSKRRHPFVGVISTISVLGICVGVAALLVVLAVMNGFDEDLKTRIIGMRSHLVVEKDGVFGDYRTVAQGIRKIKNVRGVSPFVEGQALVQKDEFVSGVLVRGIDIKNEKQTSRFFDHLKEGGMTESPARVVLGSEFAKRLHLRMGSQISMLSQSSKKPVVYTVEGIFSTGMYEYDANLVFMNLSSAQELFGFGDSVSGVSVGIRDAEQAAEMKKEIQRAYAYPYQVMTWMDLNRTLFGALKLEKIVMFLILALIIFVACLNIAGSLTILVMDKTMDIGILKSLGATRFSLIKIFALDGLLIGLVGAISGFVIGIGICFLLKNYSFVDLPKEIYYLDKLPVKIDYFDALKVFFMAVGLSFVSALYPAWMAGRLDPVKALRYE